MARAYDPFEFPPGLELHVVRAMEPLDIIRCLPVARSWYRALSCFTERKYWEREAERLHIPLHAPQDKKELVLQTLRMELDWMFTFATRRSSSIRTLKRQLCALEMIQLKSREE